MFAGYFIGDICAALLPVMLYAAAGGSHALCNQRRMIPETHSHGFQKQATLRPCSGRGGHAVLSKRVFNVR